MNLEISELEGILNTLVPDMKDSLVVGYADMRGLINKELDEYEYCIVVGKKLDDSILENLKDGPTPEYLGLYNSTNAELHQIGLRISDYLTLKKMPNQIIKPTGISKDVKNYNSRTLTYYFSHKMAATRAGLGWIGKTDLLVTEKFGPRVRFVSVLLKGPLVKNGIPIEDFIIPVVESRCGDCNICVKLCPAGAGSGREWDINTERDSFFDAYSCMKKCRELSHRNLGKNETICGICVKVCPAGKL